MSDFPAAVQDAAPAELPPARRLYWCVRRELWENRSLYVAPLAVEAVFLFGYLLSTITLVDRIRGVMAADEAKQRAAVSMPFSAAAFLMIATAFLIGVFYCLDALYGERRDRSVLFWKSLPVSDRMTVLAKASVPLVVLPLFIFALVAVTHALMLGISTLALLPYPRVLATFWSHVTFAQTLLAFLYGLVAMALWHAPIYGWLLLISAWARRTPVVWALLPPLVLAAFERGAFSTSYLGQALGYRVGGWVMLAYVFPPKGAKAPVAPLDHLTPGRFLSTPGLWLGLLFAALCIAAAIRLRRRRGPI